MCREFKSGIEQDINRWCGNKRWSRHKRGYGFNSWSSHNMCSGQNRWSGNNRWSFHNRWSGHNRCSGHDTDVSGYQMTPPMHIFLSRKAGITICWDIHVGTQDCPDVLHKPPINWLQICLDVISGEIQVERYYSSNNHSIWPSLCGMSSQKSYLRDWGLIVVYTILWLFCYV